MVDGNASTSDADRCTGAGRILALARAHGVPLGM